MSLPSLVQQLGSSPQREQVVADAVQVLEAEVSGQSGLGGLATKAAFGVLKGVRPGIVSQIVDRLFDEFLTTVEPFYQRAIAEGRAPGALLEGERAAVARGLLGVTDRRAAQAKSEALKKTYEKLRPSAQKHVEAAVPRLATLLDRHARRS